MNTEFILTFDLQSYWHIGDGRQAGTYADDIVRKNKGLPFIPGTSINGLLKDAFITAEKNNWFGDCQNTNAEGANSEGTNKTSITGALFGEGGNDGLTNQGLIQLTNATLSDTEKKYFEENDTARSHLYKIITSTAINDKGVADDKSLRDVEVTVPMKLTAQLSLNQAHPLFDERTALLEGEFEQWLALALSLLTSLGAKRSRGFGRVVVTTAALQGVC